MNFAFLNKQQILENGLKTADYKVLYKLGSPVDITCMRKSNKNKALAETYALQAKSDKVMMRYRPGFEIVFDEDYLLSDLRSCSMKVDKGVVHIGRSVEYDETKGTLVFSGLWGANGVYEGSTTIDGNDIYNDCSVIAMGMNKGRLFGLFHIHSGTDCFPSVEGEGATLDSWFDGMTLIGEAV